MFVQLCQDAVQETSYLASVCELASAMDSTDTGFSLRVHGFDHKLLDLFAVILEVLMSFRAIEENASSLPKCIKERRFEASREVLQRNYGNCGMKASTLCSDVRVRCLRTQQWSPHQKVSLLSGVLYTT
jgi:secreted Zn-dependent insulinase-like peptidase